MFHKGLQIIRKKCFASFLEIWVTLEMEIGPWSWNWDWPHLRLSEQSRRARPRINPVSVFVVYQYCICPPLPRIWIQLMDRPTAL